jgi:uncharacterized protein with gpF-like domain
LATDDSRTRPEHRAADGQVRRIGDMFDVGGAKLDAPGEPNCRCTVLILDHTEVAERLS